MIKKRYIAIFIALALVVIFSSIYTYHKNYTVQLEESLIGLERLGESATVQYDATFFQIYETMDSAIMTLKTAPSPTDITSIFAEKTNQSYFIEDMILLYEDGTYHSNNEYIGTSLDKAMSFFPLEGEEEVLYISLLPSLISNDIFMLLTT